MDNTIVNDTKLTQVPSGWGGNPTPEKKNPWRGVLILLLALAVVAFLAYWYFAAPTQTPFETQEQSQATLPAERNRELEMAAIIEAEQDLDELNFEGVSEGL